MLARTPPNSLLSAKLAPAINLEGRKFSDVGLVDDIALMLLIVDMVHEARGPIKTEVLFGLLKDYGIESLEFFRMKYILDFETWLTRFPYHLQLSNKQLSLTPYARNPNPVPVISRRQRKSIVYKLKSGILETGTPPTINQFIDLCNAVSKVDLLHLHMDLKLQSNPPYVIQWLLPEEVQIRKTALGHKVVLPVTSGDPSDQSTVPDSLNIPTSNLPQESISEALGETTVTKLYNIEDSRPQLHEPQGTVSLAPDETSEAAELQSVLLCLLPEVHAKIFEVLRTHLVQLFSIIMDQGRDILLRFVDQTQLNVKDTQVKASDIINCLSRASSLYSARPTSTGYLRLNKHMLSDAEASTAAEGYNITFRIARYITAEPTLISDLVANTFGNPPKSFLVLGAQGSGKTTLLCQIARQLSTNKSKNIRIVDRNNEMGGETGLHPRIGFARPERSLSSLCQRVSDAVKKHHADVLIVDEISNRDELAAVVDAVKRGVPIVASVSGQCPTLQSLTNDDELGPVVANPSRCVFDAVVEMHKVNHVHVYHDVRSALTAMREGKECSFEKRKASKTSSSRLALAPRREDSNSNSNSNEFEPPTASLLQLRLFEQASQDHRHTPFKMNRFGNTFNNM